MTKNLQYRICDICFNQLGDADFSLVPVTYPTVHNDYIINGDPITGSAPSYIDSVTNVYKVEYNDDTYANTWFIDTRLDKGAFAPAHLISGSFVTGSIPTVTFNFADHLVNPSSLREFKIKAVTRNNVAYEDCFVVKDELSFDTDGSGSISLELIPTVFECTLVGETKDTKFYISVPDGANIGGACDAKDILVTSLNVAKQITPQNQSLYGYTAEASDARYARSGSSGGTTLTTGSSYPITASVATSASYAKTSSVATSASYAKTSSVANTLSQNLQHLQVGSVEAVNGVMYFTDPNELSADSFRFRFINEEIAGEPLYVGSVGGNVGFHGNCIGTASVALSVGGSQFFDEVTSPYGEFVTLYASTLNLDNQIVGSITNADTASIATSASYAKSASVAVGYLKNGDNAGIVNLRSDTETINIGNETGASGAVNINGGTVTLGDVGPATNGTRVIITDNAEEVVVESLNGLKVIGPGSNYGKIGFWDAPQNVYHEIGADDGLLNITAPIIALNSTTYVEVASDIRFSTTGKKLLGTASYADNAKTASFATTASFVSASNVGGILPISKGGTGDSYFPNNYVILGDGSSPLKAAGNMSFTSSLLTVPQISTTAITSSTVTITGSNGTLTVKGQTTLNAKTTDGSALDVICDTSSPWGLRFLNKAYSTNLLNAFQFYQAGSGETQFYVGSSQIAMAFHATNGRVSIGGAATHNNPLDVVGNISCSLMTGSLHGANYIQLPYSASAKSLTPVVQTGSMYVNATDNLLYVYNGTAWKSSSLA